MKSPKVLRTITVKLADLKTNHFVRKQLDQDHVLFLAGLIEGGERLPNMMITEDMQIVDGRHRKEAYELQGIKEVRVDVVAIGNEVDLITYAFRANTGGAKPPTQADTEHTVMLLLDRKETIKNIGDLLGLPAGMTRKFAASAKSKMNRARMQRASEAVTEGGLTVAKAAEQYEVDLEDFKLFMSGKPKKSKNGIVELRRTFTRTFRSVGSKNGKAMRSLLDMVQDGDVNPKQAREVFDHVEALQKKAARAVSDWKSRFEASLGKAN